MTAASQKTQLSFQQSREHTELLSQWLRQRARPAGRSTEALCEDLDSTAVDLGRLARAVDAPPCIGIIGVAEAGKTDVVTAMLCPTGRPSRVGVGQRRVACTALHSILPRSEDGGTTAVIRYRLAGGEDVPPTTPVRIKLLSQVDLVKILTRLYYSHVPGAWRPNLVGPDLEAAIAAAGRELSANPVRGLSEAELVGLREHLNMHLPHAATLRALAASGYWEWMIAHVAQLGEAGRRRMLALLWRNEPQLSAIFARLSDGIDRLGHAGSVLCPLEALVASDRATGWMTRHPASVLSVATLLGPEHVAEADQKLKVHGGRGSSMEVERSVLAALASEVPLDVEAAGLAMMEPTEVLEFPSLVPLNDVTPTLAALSRTGGGPIPGALALRLFAHQKAAYLVGRASRRSELTALIAVVDPEGIEDDVHGATIADWVERSQGPDARSRERMETGLALVAAQRIDPIAREPGGEEGGRWPSQIARMVPGLLGPDQCWPEEWTPGRPFRNVFVLERAERAAAGLPKLAGNGVVQLPGADGAETSGAMIRPVFPDAETEPVAAAGAPADPVDDARDLLARLGRASRPAVKERQLRMQLAAARRHVRARLMRYHQSNDPGRIADWRLQIANVAVSRLDACHREGTLGHLWRALTPSEEEILALLLHGAGEAVKRVDADDRGGDRALAPDVAAGAITALWLRLMRQVCRSRRMCRYLRIAQPVLQHIVDEIAIGAARAGLADAMASELARIPAGGSADLVARRQAARATRIIGNYLETLLPQVGAAAAPAGSSAVASAPGPRHEPDGAVVEAVSGNMDLGFVRRAGAVSSARAWPAAFRRLVEQNIAAAASLSASGELDRELGELLNSFTSSPFEVEL